MPTKEYTLNGLSCASCAAKIEEGVANIEGIELVSLNFSNQTLKFEVSNEENPLNIITRVVKDLEPEVSIKEKTNIKNEDEEIKNKRQNNIKLIRIFTGMFLALSGLFLPMDTIYQTGLLITAYIISGYDVLFRALKNLVKGRVLDENFLMAIATTGAIAIKAFPEAVAVMLFYQIGEYFQERAVNHSRKSISALMDIRPDIAYVERLGQIVAVPPEEVQIGEILEVKPGEKIPLDGRVAAGQSSLNTSAITGESMPSDVSPGSKVISGSININGLLKIKVESLFKDSTVSLILDMVSNAASRKSKSEKFITKFARVYTPIVVISAVILAFIVPLVIPGQLFNVWIYRALVFLVISCPCALVVSVPLSVFGGLGAASHQGILIKGGNYLDVLTKVTTVVFDKTGTLTEGIFEVTAINPANGIKEDEFLKMIVTLENNSNHPVAQSIVRAAKGVEYSELVGFEELAGLGVSANINGLKVFAGNRALMDNLGIEYSVEKTYGTIIYLAVDGKYWGNIQVEDQIKEDAEAALIALKKVGVKRTVMLTGDRKEVANSVGASLGIDYVYSELLPQHKVEQLDKLLSDKDVNGTLLFAGDGINDAPVIARADIGVAMGGLGSDAAIEAADMVIMNDSPLKIAVGISIARKTQAIVNQNISFSLAVKILFLGLGVLGIATMWMAVFADVGVTVLAVLNSLRVLKSPKKNP